MNYLFFDTETTGLPNNGHDPRIVQLAALYTDDRGYVLDSMNVIIKPDGFNIPQGASDIHGITTEHAIKHGIPIKDAMYTFQIMLEESDIVIAHNMPFDYALYVRECRDLGLPDLILLKEQCCTMKLATPIVQCPPTERMIAYGRGHQFKSCNLQEAYTYFYGKPFEGAHDALADVKACSDVYFAMVCKGIIS